MERKERYLFSRLTLQNHISTLNKNMSESFNPLLIIGKRLKEAKEYLEQHQILYDFKPIVKEYNFGGVLAIHITYKHGTHFYKYYDFQIENPEENAIVVSFDGLYKSL